MQTRAAKTWLVGNAECGDVECSCGFPYRFAVAADGDVRLWPPNGFASFRSEPLTAPVCTRCAADLSAGFAGVADGYTADERGFNMGDKTDRVTGKVKETTGRVTGNRKLKNRGRREQEKAHLKKAGRAVKDAVKKA